ncbi:MAG: hypothetical protein ABFD13_03260 [Candidatus Cryosericum sp.]
MHRRLHIEFPGAVSLVSCTSRPGRAIISDDADVLQFLDDLAVVVAALEWRIYAWCILPDRCSFVVQTPNGDLGKGMRRFSSTYTRHVNRRSNLSGKIFTGPPNVIVLDPDTWLLGVCRHVLLLPVTSGLVTSPDTWPWSSYQAAIGKNLLPDAAWSTEDLLSRFGKTREQAIIAYTDFMQPDAVWQDPLAHVSAPGFLGSQAFADEIAHHLAWRASDPAVAGALLLLTRPPLSQIFGHDVRNEHSQLPYRVMAAVHLGYPAVQIARYLGVHPSTVARYLRSAQQMTGYHRFHQTKDSS